MSTVDAAAMQHMRPMAEADLPHIHWIERESYDYPWTAGHFADSLTAGYSMWVSEADGELTGYYAMMAAAGEAHLLNLAVAPAWRGHGHGRRLLAHCLAGARDHRAGVLFLEVRISNTVAIELYRSSGFVDLALRRGYYPAHNGREDALIMRKELPC